MKGKGLYFNNCYFSLYRVTYYSGIASEKASNHNDNFIDSYQTKLSVFSKLVEKYKTSLNSSLDESFYNGMCFLVGIVQENYQMLQLYGKHRDL